MKIISLALVMMLSGCATCQRYPAACGIGVAVAVGAIVIAASGQDHAVAPRWHRSVGPQRRGPQ